MSLRLLCDLVGRVSSQVGRTPSCFRISFSVISRNCSLHFGPSSGMEARADNQLRVQVAEFTVDQENNQRPYVL